MTLAERSCIHINPTLIFTFRKKGKEGREGMKEGGKRGKVGNEGGREERE